MRERSQDGGTAVELLVASSLLLLVLGLAMPVVVTSHRAASRVVAEDRLHSDSRSVLTEALRRLRSARPAGLCLDPPGSPLAGCLRVGMRAVTILQATGDRLCFTSLANAVDGSAGAVLPAADLVCIERDPVTDLFAVLTWKPKPVDDCLLRPPRPISHTTPCWDHAQPGRSLSIGRVVRGSPPVFSYRDEAATLLSAPGPPTLDDASDDRVLAPSCPDPAGPCLVTALARIASVRLDLRLGYRLAGRERTSEVHITVVPRGSRYSREQTWAVR